MGPPELKPAFPVYDTYNRAGYRMIPGRKYVFPANWLQIHENTMDPVHTAFLHTIVSGAVFTEEFGVLPELEYVETPDRHGLCRQPGGSATTSGRGWWRSCCQTSSRWRRSGRPAREERAFSGPMMSRWAVPLDDTNTMLIEFRHVCETDSTTTPEWWADRNIMLPGQLAADTYEEGQLHPGDYEAQVSQRPIAIHGLEHLSETDRGISMFRRQIRRGIRGSEARAATRGSVPRARLGDPDLLQQHGHARTGGGNPGDGQSN